MVAMYTIAGRQVGSHVLAMATLGTVFGGTYLATRGGGDKSKQNKGGKAQPPIQASSKEEEAFIAEFLKNAEAEDKKAKH